MEMKPVDPASVPHLNGIFAPIQNEIDVGPLDIDINIIHHAWQYLALAQSVGRSGSSVILSGLHGCWVPGEICR